METIKTLYENLMSKLDAENKMYVESLRGKTPQEIIDKSYETTCKNEFVCLMDTNNYDEYELRALLNLDNTLDYVYQDWINFDGGFNCLEESVNQTVKKLGKKLKDSISRQAYMKEYTR